MTFLQNQRILNLCLKRHILRSYRFVVEVTFNDIRNFLIILVISSERSCFFGASQIIALTKVSFLVVVDALDVD